ncbi:MAG: insulinase family protein [Candidatus Doudnabacteria bacterium]|nr:insulinase family protein [Candidatus Doudnabacteria bacterium]
MSELINTNNAVWPLGEQVDPDFFSKVQDIEVFVLPNGITVVLLRDINDRSTYLDMRVNAGSIHQPTDLRGIAHFTEHMLFQGTKRFPDQAAFLQHAEEFNLSWNGYTSEGLQSFWVESDNDLESIEEAFIHLSQLIWEPLLPESKVDKEREVVFSERQAAMSDPEQFTMEAFNNHFYDANTPYAGGGVLGGDEEIRRFTHQDVRDFHSRYFTPSNMHLLVVGGAELSVYRGMIERYFGNNERTSTSWEKNPVLRAVRKGAPKESSISKEFNHANLYMGYYLHNEAELIYPSPELFALKFAAYALSTRIFLDLRDRQGLAYAVGCSLLDLDTGFLFNFSGEFPADKYNQAFDEVRKYADDKLYEPITEQEFKRALRYFRSTRWARSGRKVANFVADNLFKYGQLIAPESMHKYLADLDVAFVNKTLHKKLSGHKLDILAVGAVK